LDWSAIHLTEHSWQPVLLLVGALACAVRLALPRTELEKHKRGARILAGRQKRRVVRRRRRLGPGAVTLAGVPIAATEETRHFKLIGTTGTGKSTAIAGLLARALERGDRAVITDPDGGYRARFFDRRR
jgi:DNA helicase HerA-like ATPase